MRQTCFKLVRALGVAADKRGGTQKGSIVDTYAVLRIAGISLLLLSFTIPAVSQKALAQDQLIAEKGTIEDFLLASSNSATEILVDNGDSKTVLPMDKS